SVRIIVLLAGLALIVVILRRRLIILRRWRIVVILRSCGAIGIRNPVAIPVVRSGAASGRTVTVSRIVSVSWIVGITRRIPVAVSIVRRGTEAQIQPAAIITPTATIIATAV